MKKTLLFLLTAAIGVSLCSHAQTVTSVNAVGMVKVTIQPGELVMLQTPFHVEDPAGVLISDLLGVMPNGTTVFIWDSNPTTGQKYISEQYFAGFGWFPGTTKVGKAQGFFVSLPTTAPETTVVFSGQVPDAQTAPTTALSIVQGLQMVGYPYPVEKIISQTNLNLAPGSGGIVSNGDTIYQWTPTGWKSEQYFEGFGWFPGTLTFKPGQAYFYSTSTGKVWNEVKPYLWP